MLTHDESEKFLCRNPVATILPTVSVTKYKPAPVIAYFSARGPSPLTRNILKVKTSY